MAARSSKNMSRLVSEEGPSVPRRQKSETTDMYRYRYRRTRYTQHGIRILAPERPLARNARKPQIPPSLTHKQGS